jgi:hypothetical protein
MNLMFAGQASTLATQRATGVKPDPTVAPPIPVSLLTTPLFHVTANNCGAYATTAAGGKMILMYRWDAGEALKIIERERVTSVGGVLMARERSPIRIDSYDVESDGRFERRRAAASRPLQNRCGRERRPPAT